MSKIEFVANILAQMKNISGYGDNFDLQCSQGNEVFFPANRDADTSGYFIQRNQFGELMGNHFFNNVGKDTYG